MLFCVYIFFAPWIIIVFWKSVFDEGIFFQTFPLSSRITIVKQFSIQLV